jgi:tetratricopeptide (TPR) repeat protein
MINYVNEVRLLLRLQQFDRAAGPLEQALRIAQANPKFPGEDLSFVWDAAGRLAQARKQSTDAEGFFRQWLAILSESPRTNVIEPDKVIDTFVATLVESGKVREAADVLGKYVQILEARRAAAAVVQRRRTEQAILALSGGDRPSYKQLAATALERAATGPTADQVSAIDLAVLGAEEELTAPTLAAARALVVRDQVPVGLAAIGTPWARAIGPRLWGHTLLQSQDLLAASLYRAGEYAAAEAAIDLATVWRGHRIVYYELLFRAMTRHRQGKRALALQDLATAEQLRQRLGTISTSQRLAWKLLAEEASQLIRGQENQERERNQAAESRCSGD